MRNVLQRMKNQFSVFYFSSYGENSSKIDHIFSANMAVPLDPACFRIEDPSLNWLASESGSQNSLQCFACIGHQDKKNSKVVIFT